MGTPGITFKVAFEIEAREDLSIISSKSGLAPGTGSFQKGKPIPSVFTRNNVDGRFSFSRLTIAPSSPANAGLERQAASLCAKLDARQLMRLKSKLPKGRFLIRIGVFYTNHPPQLELPESILSLAVNTTAKLTVDYY